MILLLLVLLVILGLLYDAFVEIKACHYGVVERFKGRTGRIIYEGLHLKLPYIEKVEQVSMKLVDVDNIKATFTTKDFLQVTCLGSLQYSPDSEIKDAKGLNRFVSISEDMIQSGMAKTIEAKLGSLGGIRKSGDFIKTRHALSDIINCFFRLKTPPHMNHKRGDSATCGLSDCEFSDCPPNSINAEDLIRFYNKHYALVKKMLDDEKNIPDRSSVEERYGIDIKYYALSDVAFSEETQKSFEKEKQAEFREKAFDKKIAMAKKAVKELNASPQEALNAADKSLDPSVKKEIISVEGQAGVLGGILGKFTGGNEKTSKKGDENG